ncbi:MAG TPA: DUF3775 domain-containing protein [Stellaceae bacterium]|nr:DUF3775 domain-containing protein [Stellaceae bacterium]
MPIIDEPEPVELNIDPGKVCSLILKAREFDAKVEPLEPEPGSNPADDESEILEDYSGDPTLEELRGAIEALDDDEVIDVIALVWVGRGDFTCDDWENARSLAADRYRHDSAAYLTGIPTLGDLLEEGLAELGYSCTDYESE